MQKKRVDIKYRQWKFAIFTYFYEAKFYINKIQIDYVSKISQ